MIPKFVQNQKTIIIPHVGSNRTLYKAMLVENPKIGLASSNLLFEVLDKLKSEDDLMALYHNTAPDDLDFTPASTDQTIPARDDPLSNTSSKWLAPFFEPLPRSLVPIHLGGL